MSMPAAVAQTAFCAPPWTPAWTAGFGERAAQSGRDSGPGGAAVARRKSSCMGPTDVLLDEDPRDHGYDYDYAGARAGTWATGLDSISDSSEASMSSALDHGIPLHQPQPQFQILTAGGQLQPLFQQPCLYSPAVMSQLLLDPETTAEDLYDWEQENSSAFACAAPDTSIFCGADPSFYPSALFAYAQPMLDFAQEQPQPQQPQASDDSGDASAPAPEQDQPAPVSPFKPCWDLAQALRNGRSRGSRRPTLHVPASAANSRRGSALSALLISPRGSQVWHVDDLVSHLVSNEQKETIEAAAQPPVDEEEQEEPASGRGQTRGESEAERAGARAQEVRTAGAKAWALNPTSPTFVPGAAFFAESR